MYSPIFKYWFSFQHERWQHSRNLFSRRSLRGEPGIWKAFTGTIIMIDDIAVTCAMFWLSTFHLNYVYISIIVVVTWTKVNSGKVLSLHSVSGAEMEWLFTRSLTQNTGHGLPVAARHCQWQATEEEEAISCSTALGYSVVFLTLREKACDYATETSR